jgi:threonine dehydrogenase-like Zn-dependent dehydrogenase
MRALQLRSPRQFTLVDVPAPSLAPGTAEHLLVRTERASICGSDVPFFTGKKPGLAFPLRPGAHAHECTGKIVASTSAGFHPGDLVAAVPEDDLGLAEYFVARAEKAVLLPDDLVDCEECTFIQPLSTVLNAVDRLGDVKGRTVAVVGLGSIGLFFCWVLRKRGAGAIVGIDPLPNRCRTAEGMGATSTLPRPADEVVRRLAAAPPGWVDPDICIEAVGHQSQTLNDCIHLVAEGGCVLAFGVPDVPTYEVEFERFFRKNARLVAVVTPDWHKYLREARDLLTSARQELAPLATHRFPILESGRAFDRYAERRNGILKAVLDATSWDSPGA